MGTLSDWGQLGATAITAAGSTGIGIKFVWEKIEARFAAVKAEAAQAMAKIEDEAERCEARERRSMERHRVSSIVMELLWRVAERAEPAAPELKRANVLMDRYKSLGPEDGVLP